MAGFIKQNISGFLSASLSVIVSFKRCLENSGWHGNILLDLIKLILMINSIKYNCFIALSTC